MNTAQRTPGTLRAGAIALSLALPAIGFAPLRLGAAEREEGKAPAPEAASASVQLPPLESLEIGPSGAQLLRGADARCQLVALGKAAGGLGVDATAAVDYEVSPAEVASVDPSGLVTPRQNGKARITAKARQGGALATAEIEVVDFDAQVPIDFPNQIVPIFTKHGCNGGGCHGKSGGQNGFKLSLLGFYPEDDHEFLVKEARGRRISSAAPEQSLLLLKATNTLPHGGGQKVQIDSAEFRLLRRWMLQNMPYGDPKAPRVARIECFPREATLSRRGRQQLAVRAHYSDGSIEDVTRMAQYESNQKELAEVEPSGLVRTLDGTGDAGIMVRFQGQVDVFRATVPLGVEVKELPPARNFIDELVFAKLGRLGLPPSALCDDATFLRRASVDIAGRLPNAEEARGFLADADPAKREKLVDRLLASSDHADYFANKWSAILRNNRRNDKYTRGTFLLHGWLRDAIYQNLPFDRLVRGVVAASGEVSSSPGVAWFRAVATTEQQVEDSAQLFLGLRIQCARCHHHPFERWSQKDYYGFSAFFSRLGRKDSINGYGNQEPRIFHQRGKASARDPRSGETLKPTGLGGAPLEIAADQDPRLALAAWMADPQNPFFAPALVNRYWKHFLGRGLVEPEDDMRVTNPPSNPELLAALAKHFVTAGFDLKDLVRTICCSSTYQLSSLPNEHNARDGQNYSRYYPRPLTAEVFYDGIHQLLGATPGFSGLPAGTRAVQLPDTGSGNYFLTVFGKPMAESACECERSQDASLAQSLHLINSSELQGKLSAGGGRAATLAADKTREDRAKLEELYFWAFARSPDAAESEAALAHLGKSENRQAAWEDVIWALMNTKEFRFNH